MFRKSSMVLAALVALAMVMVDVVRADEFQRVVLTGAITASSSNTAAFYNAKVLAVRATSLTGTNVNTMVLTQVTADGVVTNTIQSIATATSGSADVSTNGYIQLRNDQLKVSATTNFLVEVILDNRSR